MPSARSVAMLAVSLILVGILAPIGLSEIANATTTNWNASVITVFQTVLPIIAVVGLAMGYLAFGRD